MNPVLFLLVAVLLFPAIRAQQSCDYGVEILLEGDEFDSQDFKWRMRATKIEGKATNITGTAEIKDNSGKTTKSYKPWTSDPISKQKTSSEYSPNLKPGEYEITAEISVECDDSNRENNIDNEKFTINGQPPEEEKKNNKKAEAQPRAKKREESLHAVEPITDKQVAEDFDNVIQLKETGIKQSITANTAQTPQVTQTIYESSNAKAKGLIMIFLLTLSVLLNIVLVWKR